MTLLQQFIHQACGRTTTYLLQTSADDRKHPQIGVDVVEISHPASL